MNKLDCEIVRDLLPNYAEGLTGEETRAAIEKHLEECEACAELCRAIAEPLPALDEAEEAAELSFLKKNKRRNRRIGWIAAAAVGCALAALLIKGFIIGSGTETGSTSFSVDGKHFTIEGQTTDSSREYSRMAVKENDGVLNVSVRTALAGPFYNDSFKKDYWAGEDIKEVCINGKKVWERGAVFSEELRQALRDNWAAWDAMDWQSQMLSSALPGILSRQFETADEALEFFGEDIEMPFEDAEGFIKMNSVGTDVKDYATGRLMHCEVCFNGTRDEVREASLCAGYVYEGARVVCSATLFGNGLRIETQLSAGPEADGRIAVNYENWSDYDGSDAPLNFAAANITCVRCGALYWVRIISSGTVKLEELVEKVMAVMDELPIE